MGFEQPAFFGTKKTGEHLVGCLGESPEGICLGYLLLVKPIWFSVSSASPRMNLTTELKTIIHMDLDLD